MHKVLLYFRSTTYVHSGQMTNHLFFSPQTNALYCAAFEEWATQFTNVEIISDQTTTNEVRTTTTTKNPQYTDTDFNTCKVFILVWTVIEFSLCLPLPGPTGSRCLPATSSEALRHSRTHRCHWGVSLKELTVYTKNPKWGIKNTFKTWTSPASIYIYEFFHRRQIFTDARPCWRYSDVNNTVNGTVNVHFWWNLKCQNYRTAERNVGKQKKFTEKYSVSGRNSNIMKYYGK